LPLALLGAVCGVLKDRRSGFLLVATFIFYIVVFTRLANLALTPLLFGVQVRFWMQPNQILCMWVGLAAHSLCSRCSPKHAKEHAEYFLFAVAVSAVSIQIGSNWAKNDHSESRYVEDYGRTILGSMPPNSLLLLNGDIIVNSVRYLQQCEGLRLDVASLFVPTMTWKWFLKTQQQFFPNLTFPGTHYHIREEGGWSMLQFIEANRATYPNVYLCGGWYSGDNSPEQLYDLYPHGVCERLVRKDNKLSLASWARESAAALPRYPLPDPGKYDDTTWEHNVFEVSFKANHTRAFHALVHGMGQDKPLPEKRRAFQIAIRGYEQVVRDHPKPTPDYYVKNIGIAYTQAGVVETPGEFQVNLTAKGVDWFRVYERIAPRDDKDLPSIKAFLQQQAHQRL